MSGPASSGPGSGDFWVHKDAQGRYSITFQRSFATTPTVTSNITADGWVLLDNTHAAVIETGRVVITTVTTTAPSATAVSASRSSADNRPVAGSATRRPGHLFAYPAPAATAIRPALPRGHSPRARIWGIKPPQHLLSALDARIRAPRP
ncbi:hypothetical protein ABZ135_37865 [Streptomyces sp. NPDC006339]|uniref:hypothetical protein n=1 Tax=Streptomyces sp. NPDC006339 TaxID=3156755 RepID=UPI0033A5111C